MLGSMLAGHTESPGQLITNEHGEQFKEYYGMSSKKANEKYAGELRRYRAAEGKVVHIPLKGDLAETIQDIEGGIRSACTYVNASTMEEFSEKCIFIEVQAQHNSSLDRYTVGKV
jgi:GMP reductase